ncbi:MAG: aminotransferase class I/II-fold pyridoxal phosphate-dependent enzyme [Proteobacteria bacterium]|nr:MAG: aminotransferase class I/II-fold pyridoxal phosphate-dependent enzyme [Pseudomonadota bacterium]
MNRQNPNPQQLRFKLDFNERSDHEPAWLTEAAINTSDVWRYPDRSQLEETLCADMHIPKEALLLTNGGDEGIDMLFKYSTISHIQLLIPQPCFSQYSHNAEIWQNDCHFISVDANQPLAINQAKLTKNMKARQWLVITRPNNPTGEFMAQSDLMGLIIKAQKKQTRVFIDEAYIEFAEPEHDNLFSARDYVAMGNVVVLRTFSKAFGLAGARVGYLLGAPTLINRFRRLAPPFNVSTTSLQLAAQAWHNRAQLLAYTRHIAANRRCLTERLSRYGMKVFPSQGNFVLFNTNTVLKTLLFQVLKRQGILIKTALNDLPDAVRITVPFQLEPLLTALAEIFEPQRLAFDMDGVLIDTTDSYDQCIIKTVYQLSQVTVQQQDIKTLRSAGGYNNDWDLTLALLRERDYQGELQEVIDIFQRFYLGTETQAGLIEQERTLILTSLIKLISQHKTLKTAVVTGRPRSEAQLGLKKLNWQPHDVISADDVSQQKPDPEGLLKLSHQGDSQKGGFWFIGDTVDDMQAGRAAGYVCVGIGADKHLLMQAGADVVLDNVNQLESLL